jgi:Peroxisomal biogenesis factor 11 (PEX11)
MAVNGILSELNLPVSVKIEEIQNGVSHARRVARLLKEFSVFNLSKDFNYQSAENKVNFMLSVFSKSSLVIFYVLDHLALLQKWGIFGEKSNETKSVQMAMRFYTLAHFTNLILLLQKLKEQMDLEGTPRYDPELKRQISMRCVKSALLVFQGLHISGLVTTRNSLVGLAGVYTSYLDIKQLSTKLD